MLQDSLTFTVDQASVDSRLDAYLASQISHWSRARLQRLIDNEDVLVNGKSAKSSYRLRAGDEIEVELISTPIESFTPENIPLDVVYEDDVLLVINKPASLVVHPAAGIHSGTLANALAFHFQNLPSATGKARPGIVHRLDRDTSGLMVVAKTEHSYSVLKAAFRERTVDKEYAALVQGHPDPTRGTIDAPIDRHPTNDYRWAVVSGGKPSVTHYETLEAFRAATLMHVRLETGRTHQIRVHFAAVRHPCVGDMTYGADPTLAARLGLERQWLHAYRLGFEHPGDGHRVEVDSPFPADLQHALDVLTAES